MMEKKPGKKDKKAEPVFVIKPATKHGGLDYLHITLIILVAILIALAFALANFKPATVLCANSANSTAHASNSMLNANATLAISKVESIIASYGFVNTSLALLPYYALVNETQAAYMPSMNEWLVKIPFVNPLLNGTVFNMTFLLYKNLTLDNAFIQVIKPPKNTTNRAVAYGSVEISGKYACNNTLPIQVYLITDPYAPKALESISQAINFSRSMNGKVNMSYYFVFSGYAESLYGTYGMAATQRLGDYLACAAHEKNFEAFVANLTKVYNGVPLSVSMLNQLALGAKFNMTQFSSCIDNSTAMLNNQAMLASFYNVTSVPIFIVNCKYFTIPQMLNYSVSYAISQINNK